MALVAVQLAMQLGVQLLPDNWPQLAGTRALHAGRDWLAPLLTKEKASQSRSAEPPCICRRHLVSPGVEAGGVDGFPVSIFRVLCWPPRVKAWARCDLPAPRFYGPITQLVSEQG
jgi:hypothetical protein